MKFINVAYDYEYDDEDNLIDMGLVDILRVPDFVCNNLEDIVKKFNYWIGDEIYYGDKDKHPEFWTILSNGEKCMNVETIHFLKWLNDNYLQCENIESTIVERNTKYNPDYPTAEF